MGFLAPSTLRIRACVMATQSSPVPPYMGVATSNPATAKPRRRSRLRIPPVVRGASTGLEDEIEEVVGRRVEAIYAPGTSVDSAGVLRRGSLEERGEFEWDIGETDGEYRPYQRRAGLLSVGKYSRYAQPVPKALPHEILPRRRGRDSLKRVEEAEHFRKYMFLRRQLKPWSENFRITHGRTPNLADVHKAGVPGLLDRFIEYLEALEGLRRY